MAVGAIKNKDVEIVTEKFEKIFMHWMENLRDWPISRQIWWGIPIPVKYCGDCQEVIVDTEGKIATCPKCQSTNIKKDLDTFDTWFSSGQWPYATLMANDVKRGTEDFKNYFPTQVMETGWDILFFWVARMVMMSYYRTGKPPFEKVYLHGLVRDKDRQKMSKSKGNVIDPLGVIDTYGCDALRFALIFSTSAGNDIPLAEDKIKGMKHFANKLWNIARYVLANVEKSDYKTEALTEADKEIVNKLEALKVSATNNLENFRLHEAAQEIYQFIWHELADIYLEKSKEQMKDEKLAENTKKLLLHIFINAIKILHPFMPFITEELWSKLYSAKLLGKDPMLMVSKWPIPHK
jgi:valyl-tRNA synthetase